MRIKRENCTALIIDIQEKLFPLMAEKELLLANCKKLIEGLKVLQIPLFVTQQYSKGLGGTIHEIRRLFDSFSFIEKNTFSCMDEAQYLEALERSGKSNILILGIESHVCVLQTAIDLKERGYQPVVVSDCVSSRDPAEKQVALQRFALEGITVSTVESILFELTRTSSAPEFKSISNLVR